MVASFSQLAALTAVLSIPATAKGFFAKADLAGNADLKPREVTVTVTECPAEIPTPEAPPVYTTATLPPVEFTPTVVVPSFTTSAVLSESDTGSNGGATPVPISSYTPLIPIPVTPTTSGTTEAANPSPSTSVYTATTGSSTEAVSSSVITHVTTAATTHPTTATTATGIASSTTTVGAANTVPANLGLAVLVAMAALA